MKSIILASNNKDKVKEVKEILKGYDIISMKEAGIDVDIEENGTTFEENALIKARAIMKLTGQITMADDSGLEIDYLNKAPGVYSARFMGHDTSYDIKLLYRSLRALREVTEADASYVQLQSVFQMDVK